MTEKTRIPQIGPEFNVKEYVDAAGDAASRTRTTTVVLVIACVLILIGFWNSFHSSWAVERLRGAYNEGDSNIFRMLESEKYEPTELEKQKYRKDLQQQVVRGFVDNVRFIKLPFFGIAIDVNDLGTVGGFGLIVIMLMMRFSLSREIKNLNISFREALYHNDKLDSFYHALAMRQVFTVPEMRGEKRNRWLTIFPKLVCLFPAGVLTLGVSYDYYSVFGYHVFKLEEVTGQLVFEFFFLFPVIWWISLICLERQFHIDEIWDDFWEIIKTKITTQLLLNENFNKSKVVNQVLDRRLYGIREDKVLFIRLWQHIRTYLERNWAKNTEEKRKKSNNDKKGPSNQNREEKRT